MEASPQTASTHEISFLLPETLTRPLWKSLLAHLRDRISPEKLPPLHLTSRPVDVGMLFGDRLRLPWYRTVFTNLGDVIAPETLPPLELESRPVDVGELLSDSVGHMWWTSLLRNLADRIAPERLPALELTSAPAEASLQSGSLQLLRWSSLLSWPKVPAASQPRLAEAPLAPARATALAGMPQPVVAGTIFAAAQPISDPEHAHGSKLVSALSRSRMREVFWVSAAMAEVVYLVVFFLGQR
ncbi:MAG: hypothetical protein LAN83_11285 [Acidobacteriia bacterium]|nr:hypothetical protein [Terriglobia bacterium]